MPKPEIMENPAQADTLAREAQCRLLADVAGLKLIKSRTRNPDRIDFGLYGLIDLSSGGSVHPMLANRYACALDLEDVEEYLA